MEKSVDMKTRLYKVLYRKPFPVDANNEVIESKVFMELAKAKEHCTNNNGAGVLEYEVKLYEA